MQKFNFRYYVEHQASVLQIIVLDKHVGVGGSFGRYMPCAHMQRDLCLEISAVFNLKHMELQVKATTNGNNILDRIFLVAIQK